MSTVTTRVPEEDLREIVRRIVETAAPERIILFGSAARGEMGPDSDIDLLIVKAGEYRALGVEQQLGRAMGLLPYAMDMVVVTPEQFESMKDCYYAVVYPAAREGKVLYERLAA
jgi:predicted nucleotidyltransferase